MLVTLVGGKNDGKQIEVNELYEYLKIRISKEPLISLSSVPDISFTFDVEYYRLVKFAAGRMIFNLYMHEDLTTSSAMEKLLENYRKCPHSCRT